MAHRDSGRSGTRGEPVITVDGVSLGYGSVVAVECLKFQVFRGEVLALVGPNGAGKTSLLRILNRLLTPSRGAVYLDGRDLKRLSAAAVAREAALVASEGEQNLLFTVREAVALGRLPHLGPLQREGKPDRDAVDRALALTDLDVLADRPLSTLSGGQAQRVFLARALAQEPRILLLDEPTAHLDLGHQVRFLQLVRGLGEDGVTVVVALHDLNLASLYADRLLLMAGGRPQALGEPAEVLDPDLIAAAYGTEVIVQPHPISGRPQVLIADGRHGNGRAANAAEKREGVGVFPTF